MFLSTKNRIHSLRNNSPTQREISSPAMYTTSEEATNLLLE
jgi:hypothetical protein